MACIFCPNWRPNLETNFLVNMKKHKIKKIIISVLLFINLLMAFPAFSQSIDKLELNKNIFVPGERLVVNAIVKNPTDNSLLLQSLIRHSEDMTPPISKVEEISPKEIKEINLFDLKIDEMFKNGNYSIVVLLVDSRRPLQIIDSKNLNFSVIGALQEFIFSLVSCKDKGCVQKSKVFVKGEGVYFDYDSEISEPQVTGKLTAPDNSIKKLTLPTRIVLDQVGKYILEIEAKKAGYKTNAQTLELVVLEEEPKVIDKRICNANGICEPERGENIQNCPQDCPLPVLKPSRSPFFWFLVAIGIIASILIGSIIYFHVRDRRKKQK